MINGDSNATLRTVLQVLMTALLGVLTWLTYNVYTRQGVIESANARISTDIAIIQFRMSSYDADIRELRALHRGELLRDN